MTHRRDDRAGLSVERDHVTWGVERPARRVAVIPREDPSDPPPPLEPGRPRTDVRPIAERSVERPFERDEATTQAHGDRPSWDVDLAVAVASPRAATWPLPVVIPRPPPLPGRVKLGEGQVSVRRATQPGGVHVVSALRSPSAPPSGC